MVELCSTTSSLGIEIKFSLLSLIEVVLSSLRLRCSSVVPSSPLLLIVYGIHRIKTFAFKCNTILQYSQIMGTIFVYFMDICAKGGKPLFGGICKSRHFVPAEKDDCTLRAEVLHYPLHKDFQYQQQVNGSFFAPFDIICYLCSGKNR